MQRLISAPPEQSACSLLLPILSWRLESYPRQGPLSVLSEFPGAVCLPALLPTAQFISPGPGFLPESRICMYRISAPDIAKALYLISKDPKSVLAPGPPAAFLLPKLNPGWSHQVPLLLTNHSWPSASPSTHPTPLDFPLQPYWFSLKADPGHHLPGKMQSHWSHSHRP